MKKNIERESDLIVHFLSLKDVPNKQEIKRTFGNHLKRITLRPDELYELTYELDDNTKIKELMIISEVSYAEEFIKKTEDTFVSKIKAKRKNLYLTTVEELRKADESNKKK